MELLTKISKIHKKLLETEQFLSNLDLAIKAKDINIIKKEKQILLLKDEISKNIDKIDNIIDKYNAKT